MTEAMSEAIARLNKKRSPFPDDVLRNLARMYRYQSMCYQIRRQVAHALVDCFNEGRAWSSIKKTKEKEPCRSQPEF